MPQNVGVSEAAAQAALGEESSPRRHERCETNIPTIINCRGKLQTAIVRDISQSGVKIARTYGLFPGDTVNIRLPDRTKVSGKVAWSLGSDCGVEFDSPLFDFVDRWEQ